MATTKLAPVLVASLLLVPISGCLGGGEQTRRYGGGDACPWALAWTQEDVYEPLAEAGTVQEPEQALRLEAAASGFPADVQLRSIEWKPSTSNASAAWTEFRLGVHRYDADVVVLEAMVGEHGSEQAREQAAAFVGNLTDRTPPQVEDTVDSLFADEHWSRVRSSPDGEQTNVTAYRTPVSGPFAVGELAANLSLEAAPPAGEIRDVSFTSDEWRLWGHVAVAKASTTVEEREVEVKANALHELAVEASSKQAAKPGPELVNETFEQLGLPEPEPGDWTFEDGCGVDVERPDGSPSGGG